MVVESPFHLASITDVDGFLLKPISPSNLLDTILSVLGRERLLVRDGSNTGTAPPAPGAGRLAGARVLLVEDNDINREFAVDLLRSEGITVDWAPNGKQAVEFVMRTEFDAVLMDLQMPEMDGITATMQIRALAGAPGGERFASLPIIAMTALAMDQDAARCRRAGMNDVVTKPIDPPHLIATLGEWIHLPPWRFDPTVGRAPEGHSEPSPEVLALTTVDALEGIERIGGDAHSYVRQLKRFRKHYGDAIEEPNADRCRTRLRHR